MAKKKSLLSLLKRLFITDTTAHLKPEKEKKRRWVFQRLKMKRFASLPPKEIALQDEAEDDEQSKHDLTTMAIPTVAESEAAAGSDAHVAAEVAGVNGKSSPQSFHKCEDKESQEAALAIRIQSGVLQSIHQFEKEIQELAAVKIQTSFRGHLARKALRALKGLVKLQAIIRGRAVRRQAINTLKCLQSIVSIQSRVCARRCELPEETCQCHENKQLQELRDKVMKIESSNHRRWDDSILTKQEANVLFLSKKEAIMKQERIKEYALNYRKSTESDENKANGNLRYWLEQWVDTQLAKRKDLKDLDLALPSNPRLRDDHSWKQQNSNFFQKHEYRLKGLVSPISVPRRRSASFHQRKLQYNSISVDEPPGSPAVVFPTYMAATESAKAKTRSISSPKLRSSSSSSASFDYFSECNSPFKNKLSMGSPISTREVTSSGSGRIGTGKFDGYFHQRSPSLKSIPGLVKSTRTIKDLSFDSDCSLLNWDRHSNFRLS